MPPVDQVLVETLDPEGPYGGKECGQGPLLPVIPAVANALRDALGVSIDEVPVTREKVLAALSTMKFDSGVMAGPIEFGPDDRAAQEAAIYIKFDGSSMALVPGSYKSVWKYKP
jgi:branched-chain amino acid transport system substrate-binding protein